MSYYVSNSVKQHRLEQHRHRFFYKVALQSELGFELGFWNHVCLSNISTVQYQHKGLRQLLLIVFTFFKKQLRGEIRRERDMTLIPLVKTN